MIFDVAIVDLKDLGVVGKGWAENCSRWRSSLIKKGRR